MATCRCQRPVVLLAVGVICCVLAGCTAPRDRKFSMAVLGNNFQVAEELIAQGANVDHAEGWDRETTLMLAASSPDFPAVEFLIKVKANVRARGHKGMTPIMYAAMNGQVKNIQLLAAAGADVNAKANGGQSAVSIAKARKHLEAVEALEAVGGNDDAPLDII